MSGLPQLELWLHGYQPRTRAIYRKALEEMARFLGLASAEHLIPWLCSEEYGPLAVSSWRAGLLRPERGLRPASINLRLAALRSLARRLEQLKVLPYHLEVASVPAEAARDRSGATLRERLAARRSREDGS